jgi:phytanoyl-CoA hydroxylase
MTSRPPTVGPLWLDASDALDCLQMSTADAESKAAAKDLIADGITVLRGCHDRRLCDAVIADYRRYVDEHRGYVQRNLDELGREKRLVNFHLWSENAMALGTSERTMRVLDYLFGREAAIYTSLTFKYGTQQPVHKDTPHFATWPPNYFFGVWTALEDVHPDAGPVFYHRGAHRLRVDRRPFAEEARCRIPAASDEVQHALALDLYNGAVIREAPAAGDVVIPALEAGDVLIWHPEMPHGGSPARDPLRTRWSIVFHCAPVDVQVFQHDRFFSHWDDEPPPDRYGYRRAGGRRVALAGDVAYM